MNSKIFPFSLGFIFYLALSTEGVTGAWKRVQQSDSWDQATQYISRRLEDLQDAVEYRGSELDKLRLALWQARQAAVFSKQKEVRSSAPNDLKSLLAFVDDEDKVKKAKDAKKIAKHEAQYQAILRNSHTSETVVKEPGFYGGTESGQIYCLPPKRDPKGKERVGVLNPESPDYDEEAAMGAAMSASLRIPSEDSVGSSYSFDPLLDSEVDDLDLALAIELSLRALADASSSRDPGVGSSAFLPDEKVMEDNLDFGEI